MTGKEFQDYLEESEETEVTENKERIFPWGYGAFNALADGAEAFYRKLSGLNPKYQDKNGDYSNFPQDKGMKRRAFFGLGRDTLLALAGASLLVGQDSDKYASKPSEAGLELGEWYSFEDVNKCLEEEDKQTLESNLGQPEDHIYKIEQSTEERGNFDIYVAESYGESPDGKIQDTEFNCELR